ncbi:MAG: carboxypeptidase-like regulatory domain-containing protein [Bacteroidales bacterium]|nr:carboxypeptidase-like regulatory domain-containing protein [Bacteroidales bacterium]
MKLKPSCILLAVLMFVHMSAGAQTTKVRGRVTDEQGEGIPFVGVYFVGTTTGITTDLEGCYNLESKDLTATVLVAQLLGYDPVGKQIHPGQFNEVDFVLRLTDNRLTGAKVKADNKKAKALLANIQKHRDRNDPENHPEYTCEIYNKIELDLTHPKEQLSGRRFDRNFGFVFDYVDTSAVSGVPYLPVMISETVASRTHRRSPESNSERIIANRISGIDADANNMLSQFTGSMHQKVNFYNPYISAFDVQFPSPIQEGGLMFYNYYIIDSLMVDGRKTLLVRYHPKALVSVPAFDGEMRIDAEDYAIRSIHANMKNTTNVNWLRDLVIDAEYERQADSTWFYKSDRLYADLSLSLRDSSRMLSFIGRKEIVYSKVEFSYSGKPDAALVKVSADAGNKDESFWDSSRPVPLTEKEREVYEMVEKVKTVPAYRSLYDIVYTAINGYYEVGKIGYGPYFKLISHNNMEGWRPQFGMRTSKEFSRKDRFTVYGAFGLRDKTPKGGLTWEHLWSREPERKLTLKARYDVNQLGSSPNAFTEGNIFGTIFGASHGARLAMMSSFSGNYKHEVTNSFNIEAGFDFRRYYPNNKEWLDPVKQVPMLTPSSVSAGSVASNEFYLAALYCKDLVVNRGLFTKSYVHSKYPTITLSLAGSLQGLRKDDYSYFRPELTFRWSPRIPPFGVSRIYAAAGRIIGTVPYPMLHFHEGNSSYIYDRLSFACMDYMEFVSDSWVSVFYTHCFNGFFLGTIPLIRRLGWREEFTFRATWGSLSDRNNGNLAVVPASEMTAPLIFPAGTSSLGGIPYIEFGAGVSNILKFIRVDCFWRATHRDERVVVIESESELGQKVLGKLKTSNFAVKIGAEFKF